ncbi:MAG: aspartate carbamoyltransferase, partial [Patescibacteria group bacterium]|nr:aspartate carbamoyltransferase [Patescibacteria group bacterium]
MLRLGGKVFPINEIKTSSVAKGETLEDTIKTLEQYADVIVLRHPEAGSAQRAAAAADIPIINAGDGAGEHPTQALLDLFTIIEEKGGPDGLSITLLGDLKHGRTVHSLARLLSNYDVRLNLVSPKTLGLPKAVRDDLSVSVTEHDSLESALPDTDVLYVTRVQRERFAKKADYDKVKGSYVVSPESLVKAKDDLIVLHPLPRVDEIDARMDADPRAAYFREVRNGLYVRMALLALVLG